MQPVNTVAGTAGRRWQPSLGPAAIRPCKPRARTLTEPTDTSVAWKTTSLMTDHILSKHEEASIESELKSMRKHASESLIRKSHPYPKASMKIFSAEAPSTVNTRHAQHSRRRIC